MAYEQPSCFLRLPNLTIGGVLSLLAAALDAGGVTAELAIYHVVPCHLQLGPRMRSLLTTGAADAVLPTCSTKIQPASIDAMIPPG